MRKKVDIEERYPGLIAMLGTKPDASVADEYGLTRARIHQIRKEHDIDAFIVRDGSGSRPTFRNEAFKVMRDLWLGENEARRVVDLAEALDMPHAARRLSDWAHGNGGRVPSMDLLVRLADLLGCQLVCDRSGILIRHRKIRAAGVDIKIDRQAGESFA